MSSLDSLVCCESLRETNTQGAYNAVMSVPPYVRRKMFLKLKEADWHGVPSGGMLGSSLLESKMKKCKPHTVADFLSNFCRVAHGLNCERETLGIT